MSWYKSGSISVTNGSATVTGAGTAWIANAAAGEGLLAPDGKLYEIASIASDTSLTLGSNYLGTTLSGQAYQILPSQGYLRDLAAQAAALVNNYSTFYNGVGQGKFGDGTLGAPGLAFASDTDTGIFRSSANVARLAAGGVAAFEWGPTGTTVYGLDAVYGAISVPSLTANSVAIQRLRTSGHIQLATSVQLTAPYTVSLQAKHDVTDGQSYPIALNPVAGAVMIGQTTSDGVSRLEVNGQAIIQGQRPVTFDPVNGTVRIKGNTGGWSCGLAFSGNAGTDKGGFGALGSADALTNYWIGPSYSAPNVSIDGTTGKTTFINTAINISAPKTPASATAAGAQGDICWDTNFVYVCVATNTWKRSAITTW